MGISPLKQPTLHRILQDFIEEKKKKEKNFCSIADLYAFPCVHLPPKFMTFCSVGKKIHKPTDGLLPCSGFPAPLWMVSICRVLHKLQLLQSQLIY